MKLNRPEFEGVIYGIEDLPYRKIVQLFKNAFEQCEYEFIEDKPAGAMILSGAKDLLLSEEDRVAMFDLVCAMLTEDARGMILSREWSEDGAVRLTQYVFKRGAWEEKPLETG
jgi:hypothetical protein